MWEYISIVLLVITFFIQRKNNKQIFKKYQDLLGENTGIKHKLSKAETNLNHFKKLSLQRLIQLREINENK